MVTRGFYEWVVKVISTNVKVLVAIALVLDDNAIKDGHQKVINTPLKQALPDDTVFYTGVSRTFPDRQYMVVKPGTA